MSEYEEQEQEEGHDDEVSDPDDELPRQCQTTGCKETIPCDETDTYCLKCIEYRDDQGLDLGGTNVVPDYPNPENDVEIKVATGF